MLSYLEKIYKVGDSMFISGNRKFEIFKGFIFYPQKIKQFLGNFIGTRGVFKKILSLIILFLYCKQSAN